MKDQLILIETIAGEGAAGKGISGVQRAGWKDVKDMTALAELLAAPSPARAQGTHEAQGVLILAGPGTGKTWSTQQLAYELARRALVSQEALPVVPLLIPVQRMLSVIDATEQSDTLLVKYITSRFSGDGREALLQAHELRSLVVILDGADEAADLRKPIEKLVLQELESVRVVLSSRPQVGSRQANRNTLRQPRTRYL